MSSAPLRPRTTVAFFVQSAISFAISLGAVLIGILYLHGSPWVRGFLALGMLYVVTSTPGTDENWRPIPSVSIADE